MPKGKPKNGVNKSWFKKGQVSLNKGIIASSETRLKQRNAKLGRKVTFTEEHRENLSKALRGKTKPWLKGKKRLAFSEEWRKKISASKVGKNVGEKSGRWIKDRTKLAVSHGRRGTLEVYWSRSIKKRDGWRCRMNDVNCNGVLEAHHILSYVDYPELRYNLDNGISLCYFHHPRGRVKAEKAVEFLQSLINKK